MRKVTKSRDHSLPPETLKYEWFQNISLPELVWHCQNWAQEENRTFTIFEDDVALYDIIPQEAIVVDLLKENPDNGTE